MRGVGRGARAAGARCVFDAGAAAPTRAGMHGQAVGALQAGAEALKQRFWATVFGIGR